MTKLSEAERRWLNFSTSFKPPAGSLLWTQGDEVWKSVPEYDGLYEVSNFGRIRKWWRGTRSKYHILSEPIMLRLHDSVKDSHVYTATAMRLRSGRKMTEYVHLVVLRTFSGPRPSKKHECAHFDGDGKNNDLLNLRWATYADQESDKVRLGRHLFGERSGTVKLTEAKVREIKLALKNAVPQHSLAALYGVSRSNIGLIAQGRRWKHLDA